ncbi:OmpA family protein [Maridesulfovibrio sp.]|uniref:OmpA family protein n=1 Tax=Maridesulfovibrio sp. TaxID=2795000 RepID=UPI002A18CDD2|nr:OmpA family protein [Maridesulfovibrio sp.]
MKKFFCTLVMLLVCATMARAGQDGFAGSADEILNMLTGDSGRVYLKIEFSVNSAKISPKAIPVVNALGQALTSGAASAMKVKLVGHTDSAGKSAYNRKLSLERATAVKQYLTGHFKIDSSRISVEGMGEDRPIASNDTPIGRASNRRVEVINMGSEQPENTSIPEVGKGLFQ